MNTTYGGFNERIDTIDSVGDYDPATLVTPDNEYTHFTNGRFNNVLIKFQ